VENEHVQARQVVALLRLLASTALAMTLAMVSVSAGAASAKGGNPLERYVADLNTWSADFRQIVVDSSARKISDSQGRLIIVRPGKFRWESAPEGAEPGAQLLVADGRSLWFMDRDLQQATVRPLDQALPQSPALLLAGGTDLSTAFEQRGPARRDGLDWVDVMPRDPRSDFREASFAFKDGQLARMVVTDKLGQRSELRFTGVQKNRSVDPALVAFELPAGVDLIGAPAPSR
jgi:outer membrane lipoprotein carrier protein